MRHTILPLIVILAIFALFSPFFPGEYDPFRNPVSLFLQVYSIPGLITCIPAILLFYQLAKFKKSFRHQQRYPVKLNRLIKVYIWTFCIVLIPVMLVTFLGISWLLGISVVVGVVTGITILLIKILRQSSFVPSYTTAIILTVFPVLLLVLPLILAKPMTNFSRSKAMVNSQQLIDDLENYKSRHGRYPPTLNGLWKDYKTGISGIEKYTYSFSDSTFNLYFEQPKFLTDRFGTREIVVYNPTDDHVMLSHTSWHILLEPHQLRRTQGWYASFETGRPHWKYFWFD